MKPPHSFGSIFKPHVKLNFRKYGEQSVHGSWPPRKLAIISCMQIEYRKFICNHYVAVCGAKIQPKVTTVIFMHIY